MTDPSNLPPPTGPRFAAPAGGPLWGARPGLAPAPGAGATGGDAWAAPTAPLVGAPGPESARAVTVEGLALVVPEVTGTVELDIPEAAKPVALTHLNGVSTKVLIGGRPVRVGAFAKIAVPLKDGTRGSLRIGGMPGYPVVTFRKTVIYRHPRPQGWEWALLVASVAVPIVALGIGMVPALIGFGAGVLHVRLIKSGAATWIRVALPITVLAGWVLVGAYVYSHLGELTGSR